ncbi:damage-control phosphatase ARMT1 family protein [Nocardia puris]|uniref:Uncharacterized protein DUF89 n=1 Tax=Nocardia puris TaxID=208602 RepID=A0A366DRT7_9NOCA|nr:damage-control phosphatase ARMT1 family protein [Nocardia puris]RBO92793.1 uncharacterized protein DUF89 [Nocardia puris]
MDLPPPISLGTPDSFARSVFHERHPKLIEQVIGAHPYGAAQRAALRELLAESTGGVIERIPGNPADAARWEEWGRGMWGRPWSEASFLWGESYFYRRILAAVEYDRPGIWCGVDPFAPTKRAELCGGEVEAELSALGEFPDTEETRTALLMSALWGNQADLSFQLVTAAATRAPLLVDDSAVLWDTLPHNGNAAVAVIADNAGRELLPDLVLIDHLLNTSRAQRVSLYLKPAPYYVSDATMADLLATLRVMIDSRFEGAAAIGRRLRDAMVDGQLELRTHEFFCAPLDYRDLPEDLATELARSTLTILKGDLNYRRLLGDRNWPPTTVFGDLVAYFPTPVAALRTLKSDVIAGLTAECVRELDATGRPWRTTGEYAVIQVAR